MLSTVILLFITLRPKAKPTGNYYKDIKTNVFLLLFYEYTMFILNDKV